MNDDDYRSYVIRVRRHGPAGPAGVPRPTTRLDVEDLLEGGTATVSGEPARSLADSLERLVDNGRTRPPSDPAQMARTEHDPGSGR